MLLEQISSSDSSVNENPQLRTLAIEAFKSEAPVLKHLQFRSIVGNSFTDKAENELNGAGENRTVNNDYTATTTDTPEVTSALRMFGDRVKTDISFERRFPGKTIASERARQLKKFCTSLGRGFQAQIFNGTGTSPEMQGIKGLCTGAQLLAMGANGANVSLGSDNTAKKEQQAFITKIEELLSLCPGATFLAMDTTTLARLKSIGKEYVTTTNAKDIFGVNHQMADYMGIPIVLSGYASDNTTKVITQTETKGTATSICTSIYAVKCAEDSDLAYLTSTGMAVKDLGLNGVHYETLIELDCNAMLYHAKAVARLEGIIIN